MIKIESSDSFQLALYYFTDLSRLLLLFKVCSENVKPITEGDGAASISLSFFAKCYSNIRVDTTFGIDKKRCFVKLFRVGICVQYKYTFRLSARNPISFIASSTSAAKVAWFIGTVGVLITRSFFKIS